VKRTAPATGPDLGIGLTRGGEGGFLKEGDGAVQRGAMLLESVQAEPGELFGSDLTGPEQRGQRGDAEPGEIGRVTGNHDVGRGLPVESVGPTPDGGLVEGSKDEGLLDGGIDWVGADFEEGGAFAQGLILELLDLFCGPVEAQPAQHGGEIVGGRCAGRGDRFLGVEKGGEESGDEEEKNGPTHHGSE